MVRLKSTDGNFPKVRIGLVSFVLVWLELVRVGLARLG